MQTIQATDVSQLISELRSRPYSAAFPKQLPDRWLRPIARDLRQIEQLMAQDDLEADAPMAGPVVLAMHILEGRLQERGQARPVSLSVEQVSSWLQVYQFLVERELVTRLIDQPCASNEEVLLSAIDFMIDQLVARGGDETVQAS